VNYLGNGDAGQELVQLFVVSDGEQQVSEITAVVFRCWYRTVLIPSVGKNLYPVFTCGLWIRINQNPDQREKSDLDLHQSEKRDSDLRQSEKRNPDSDPNKGNRNCGSATLAFTQCFKSISASIWLPSNEIDKTE
jgi:hypothetical protein